ALITVGPSIIPPPAGVDMNSAESLAAGIHLFEPRHFVFPFLAHALGTYLGALLGFLLSPTRGELMAWLIGALSLAGGIAASMLIPAPAAFIAIDLIFAYLPMAWLAIRTGRAVKTNRAERTTAAS
ncbi:MAG TPA: hypothetical protein VIC61_04845, partial [Gammaproteobacteria bacterium]